MAKPDDYDTRDDPGWFRDELRQRDRRIAELREEIDDNVIWSGTWRRTSRTTSTRWRAGQETFGMVLTDEGWAWEPFWDEHNELIDEYNALVRRWNKYGRTPRKMCRTFADETTDAGMRADLHMLAAEFDAKAQVPK